MELINNHIRGVILAIIGFGIFSMTDALSRIFAHEGYSVFQIVMTVQWIGLAVLLCFSRKLGGLQATLASKNKKLHFMRAICVCVSVPANVYAFSVLPFALTYTLLFTGAFWLVLFSGIMTREVMNLEKIYAIIIGMIGAIIVLRPWADAFDWRMLIPIVSAILYGVQSLMARRMGGQETPLSLAFYTMLMMAILTTLWVVMRGDFIMPDMTIAPLFVMSGIMVGIATLCLPLAFRYAPANIVGPIHYTQLIWAAFVGFFLFHETPDVPTIVGGTIIMCAGLWTILAARRKSR